MFDISTLSLGRHPTLSSADAMKTTEAALQELNSFMGDNYLQNSKPVIPKEEVSDLNVCTAIHSSFVSFTLLLFEYRY